jgi:heme/copper-type cytochrome/quinol oxidase subunit 4
MVLANQNTRGTGTWLLVFAAIVILTALGLLWIMAKDNAMASVVRPACLHVLA